jgi:hypothetical protein
MTLVGDRIPWEAVITARWAWNALLTGPGVELRLRRVDGYEPPRSGKVAIDPTLFDISGNVLLDLIERYARPHTVYVLAPRHRPDLAIFWLPRVVIGGEGARPVHPRGGAPEPLGIVLRCRSSSIEVMFCGVRWLGASIFIPHAILAGPRSSRICKPARCARPP